MIPKSSKINKIHILHMTWAGSCTEMKSLSAPCSTGAISKNGPFIPEPGVGFFAVANLSQKDSLDCAWTQGLDSSCKWRCGAREGYIGGAGCTCWEGKEGQSLVLQPCQQPLGDVGAACWTSTTSPSSWNAHHGWQTVSAHWFFSSVFFLNGRHNPEFFLKLTK